MNNYEYEAAPAIGCLIHIPEYNLKPVKVHAGSNEEKAWEGFVEHSKLGRWAEIRIECFRNFFNVSVAFGEVRNVWSNHTPLGEFGIASASGQVGGRHLTNIGDSTHVGCALPGYHIPGLAYRVGMVGPKDRVSNGVDMYIESSDIIAWLLSCRMLTLHTKHLHGSAAEGAWENARPGW